jgi:hypothetical protein
MNDVTLTAEDRLAEISLAFDSIVSSIPNQYSAGNIRPFFQRIVIEASSFEQVCLLVFQLLVNLSV